MKAMTSDYSRAYSVPEDNTYSGSVRTTVSETYNQEGAVWVSVKIEIPGSQPYFVEFDNPDQVRECWEALGAYLQNRGTFRRAQPEDGEARAAEPQAEYI